MNTEIPPTSQFDEAKAQRLLAEAAAWEARQAKNRKEDPLVAWTKARSALNAALAALPEEVTVPFERTPEGERLAKFRDVCSDGFFVEVDFAKIRCPAVYRKVMAWDGRFPGPCCYGGSGQGKTFAAWQLLRRLYVEDNKPFAWFPVRRLVAELALYEEKGCADEFFRTYDFFKVLFVDDLDKINWDFESHVQMLFSFMDWVYRTRKPCILTTNHGQAWWKDHAGEAMVRRMFVDGCRGVEFR